MINHPASEPQNVPESVRLWQLNDAVLSHLSLTCRHNGGVGVLRWRQLSEGRTALPGKAQNIISCLLLRGVEFAAHCNLIQHNLWLLFGI